MEAKAEGVIPEHITTLEELETSKHGISVFPDIIVHHRAKELDNLLIVEIKKQNNPDMDLGWDEFKIDFFIKFLHYQAGVFVVFNTELSDGEKTDRLKIIWFY